MRLGNVDRVGFEYFEGAFTLSESWKCFLKQSLLALRPRTLPTLILLRRETVLRLVERLIKRYYILSLLKRLFKLQVSRLIALHFLIFVELYRRQLTNSLILWTLNWLVRSVRVKQHFFCRDVIWSFFCWRTEKRSIHLFLARLINRKFII